jgi:hypothetical protein
MSSVSILYCKGDELTLEWNEKLKIRVQRTQKSNIIRVSGCL